MRYKISLNKWKFSVPELSYEEKVTLPHTWNVTDEVMMHRGEAVYDTVFTVAEELLGKRAFIKFGAVYHSASVYVNGGAVGEHRGSGYTPFEFDITDKISLGENTVTVVVNNAPSEDSLPYLKNFDWADDGGLIRRVEILFTEPEAVRFLHVCSEISEIFNEKCSGKLILTTAFLDGKERDARVRIYDYANGKCVIDKNFSRVYDSIALDFSDLKLWTPYAPCLYRVALETDEDYYEIRTGVRKIEVDGEKILFNGEEIYLKGCEWMPGSHSDFGMAEPLDHSIKCLRQLKDSGCVFTRFHWQQDSALYDWCDENGLLVQEEIPYWGYPKSATPIQLEIAKRQANEMVYYHKNHPSVICWGVGNEIEGADEKSIEYVKEMVAYFKTLDGSRLVNYVSNTLAHVGNIELDEATRYGDIAMWNDYLGLWEYTENLEEHAKRACEKCAGMPLVVSEFGLCEPRFKGGDNERARILESRLKLYSTIRNVAGYVWFSLNDYRTHIGEEGSGKMCRRVHGSSDIYANPKPSYRLLSDLQSK